MRTHPAIAAHAAATAAALMPGRFFLGVGSGENLNGHVIGAGWPAPGGRLRMLDEAIEVIRLLWQGGRVGEGRDRGGGPVNCPRRVAERRAEGRSRAGAPHPRDLRVGRGQRARGGRPQLVGCGLDPEGHLEAIRAFEEAGFDSVYVHQVGPRPDGFFRFY